MSKQTTEPVTLRITTEVGRRVRVLVMSASAEAGALLHTLAAEVQQFNEQRAAEEGEP